MKNLFQVLREKELDIVRVRKEIAAIHAAIPLLAEESDWIENGLAPPRLPPTGTAGRLLGGSHSTQFSIK